MTDPIIERNLRILIVDDNRAIHGDFRKILCPEGGETNESWQQAEAALLGEAAAPVPRVKFELDSAYQGREALAMVEQAVKNGRPYAMAFLDVRMPPGWDGVETAGKLWEACPDLQVVICTAYSDYSWEQMSEKLNGSDRLLLLKKPFDTVEVLQLANALTEKWRLHQQARLKVDELEGLVRERTRVLSETNASLQAEIVERQRAAEALRQSEERYQLLFSTNPLPMWVFDRETLEFLAVNDAAVREYGYSAEEFLAMTVKEIRPAEEIPALMERLATLSGAGDPGFVTRHRLKNDRRIDVEVLTRPITYGGRQAKLVLASNITERKAAEDRIREQAALLDLAHDAIYVRDLSGRIQFWNKGAERLFGWTATEVMGRSLREIFPIDFTGAMNVAERMLVDNGEWSGELRKQNRQRQDVMVDSRWTLLRDEAGRPRSVLVINADVTEKKKLEAQFLRSQRMEGIGTLATGMAHDLNNVLAPILMSAGSLRWELSAEERELAISRIELSVKRGAEIIQQVLTFGRGVTGERVAVKPGEVVGEVARIIGQTFPKDIVLTEDLKAGLWPILGDRTQIHQVLLNLCINARDAMPKGGRLLLRAENVTVDQEFAARHTPFRAGSYVRLEVSDTGEGIPAANLEKIFDPFFTTKEFGKGTGLGLSTVLGIVKSHHGLVTVESMVNQGATFKVLLPASPVPARGDEPEAASALPRGDGETILVVDDESHIVTAARRMLEQHGYKTLSAGNGCEALAVFTRNAGAVDVVLTDIMMPAMDGLALIKALRRIDPDTRIVASSGLGKELLARFGAAELEELRVNTFLAKPYSAQCLLTALHRTLRGAVDAPPAELAVLV